MSRIGTAPHAAVRSATRASGPRRARSGPRRRRRLPIDHNRTNPVLRECGMEVGRPPPARVSARVGDWNEPRAGARPLEHDPARFLLQVRTVGRRKPADKVGTGMGRVIGIDVSQARLDVYGLEDGRRLAVGNDAAGISQLVGQLELGAGDLLVMEASGGYERAARRRPTRDVGWRRVFLRSSCASRTGRPSRRCA